MTFTFNNATELLNGKFVNSHLSKVFRANNSALANNTSFEGMITLLPRVHLKKMKRSEGGVMRKRDRSMKLGLHVHYTSAITIIFDN